MKNLLLLLLALVMAPVQAQTLETAGGLSIEAERARIQQDRMREERRYATEDAACYQRFAVTDCLRAVQIRRRETFDELRRQEILLNDLERKRRGAEQLGRIEEKASEQTMQQDAQRRAAAQQEQKERQERTIQKNTERMNSAKDKDVAGHRTRTLEPGAHDAVTRAEEKKIFDEKQRQAQERKASRDRNLKEKSGSPSKPLPEQP